MIDSLRRVLEYAIDYLDIVPDSAETDADIIAVSQMLAAYDALAPDWADAPNGAQWYTIAADGIPRWHVENPSQTIACDKIMIPIGIDWRLLIWQRPEVTP